MVKNIINTTETSLEEYMEHPIREKTSGEFRALTISHNLRKTCRVLNSKNNNYH